MTLTAVTSSAPDRSWVAVLEASTRNSGVDPYNLFVDALEARGSTTVGPDSSGEYTSNCPHPEHGNGDGDQQRSFRWRQASDGQVLFTCHAGCDSIQIIETMGLTFLQLKWSRTEYHYRSDLRELLAVHVRAPQPGNRKKFWWEHPENNSLISGRGPGWEPVLWCLPDALESADHAHKNGKSVHIWLCEGEKDSTNAASAFHQGWTPSTEQSSDWVHIVTTSADGAAAWDRALTEQIIAMGPSKVTVVCDSDETGTRRGALITDALHDINPQLDVSAISWTGKLDATDAIEKWGRNWLAQSVQAADADVYQWCSLDTGWLYETEAADVKGNPSGKATLHRVLGLGTKGQRIEAVSRWPVRVMAGTVDTEGHPVGWELDLGGGGRAMLRTTDLTGSNIDTWNAKHGVFIVNARQLTPALRAYLGFHGNNVGAMTVYDHEGWVDEHRFVTDSGMLIGPEGESACAALAGTEGTGGTEWHYGLGDESEAAQAVSRLLTFRDLRESGPVLAWLTGQAVRPRALAASGASFVPMLQVPGASGVGKTSFLKLATRIFGFSGNPISNVTSAGLVRTLALTTGVVWIDDFSSYGDDIRSIIRGGLTGAGRTRGTTASERGIVRDEAHASLINSGEHAFDANERAMSQRSVILEFSRAVQGRLSIDSPGQEQYPELEAMGVSREDKGLGLSKFAGTVIKGLWASAAKVNAAGEGTGSSSGIRGQAAWEFVAYGAHVLAQWMRDNGISDTRVEKFLSETLRVCTDQAREATRREKTGADVYLVQEIIPRYLSECRGNADPAITAVVTNLSPEEIKSAIRNAWRAGAGDFGTTERGAKAVVVLVTQDEEGSQNPLAVAVNSESLYHWASGVDGLRAGVSRDERHISVSGLSSQLKQVADKTIRDPADSTTKDGCLRIRLGRGSQSPRYRLITEPEVVKWLTQ